MATFKISKKYWESLRSIEQEFIKERIHSGKSNISECKQIIADARKRIPGFEKIYGPGIIEKEGKTYKWTGPDTKNFIVI